MLEKSAVANKRSLNMEVIARLERSFEFPDPSDAKSKAAAAKLLKLSAQVDPLEERVAELEHRVEILESKRTGKTG
jgi:uncharacterized protein YceH (UPF0502 family)